MKNKIQGVILDIDGTLIESNSAHAQAFHEAFQEKGFYFTAEQIFPLIGRGGTDIVQRLTGLEEENEVTQKILKRHGEIFRKKLPSLKVFSKVPEFLKKVKKQGLKIVIGSSATEKDLEKLLDKIQIKDLIDDVVSSDDVKRAKPYPDIVEAALKKLNLNSSEALMLGDTPYDIEAALQAGVSTVAVLSGGWGREALREALVIYKDVEDLFLNFESSVFFASSLE